jgi:hypothetical protein
VSKRVGRKKPEEEKEEKILNSKLLSGGIENRFLTILSKDAVSSLRDLSEVTMDKVIKECLTSKSAELDEDQIYESIIHEGKDENVDRVIDLLQFHLEKKHIWAKTGKDEGLRLSRAAFACMLKISDLYTDFVMMVDETEMNLDSVDDSASPEAARKQLAEDLKILDGFKIVFKRFESAGRMRSWYQEKKKSWANKIKKEEEEKKKKEEEKNEEEKEEDKKDDKKDEKKDDKKDKKDEKKEEKKEEQKEETIDTTKGKDDAASKKKTKDQVELAKIVDKVCEKAELLIKLSMPTQWGGSNTGETPLLLQNQSEREQREKEEEDVQKTGDWMTKLKTWKERQTQNIVASEKEDAAIFSSSSASVLAVLQAPISSQRIKKQIESTYVNAMKRICGFRLIARLSYMNHSVESRTEYLNWFCSSLRQNTNMLTHYTHNVTGCGEHLKNEMRKAFFLVFNGIVKQLKDCTDEEDIKFLLNCCKWQFTASDHDNLIRSGIFEVLSDGNGKKEKDQNPIKYVWGHSFTLDAKEDYPLCQDVLDLFEQILMA